jgi:hypothetical protein
VLSHLITLAQGEFAGGVDEKRDVRYFAGFNLKVPFDAAMPTFAKSANPLAVAGSDAALEMEVVFAGRVRGNEMVLVS